MRKVINYIKALFGLQNKPFKAFGKDGEQFFATQSEARAYALGVASTKHNAKIVEKWNK